MLKGSRLSSLSSSLVTSTTVQAHYLESAVTNFWHVIKRARDTGTITQYTAKIEEDD